MTQSLKMASSFMPLINEGKKNITIRNGKRNISEGLLTVECAAGKYENIEINVTKVITCKLGEVTLEDLRKDGFIDQYDMLGQMRNFYPDIKYDSEVTVIHFNKGN